MPDTPAPSVPSPPSSSSSPGSGAPWPGAFTHFVGLDWAKDHHSVSVVDRAGAIVAGFEFDHTAAGWADLAARLDAIISHENSPDNPHDHPSRQAFAVAVETSRGVVVERLVQLGLAIYPVRPLAAKAYRERKAPSGVKDDALDAWSLADALRLDGHTWRRLRPDDPMVQELRLLCRDEVHLIQKRTALVLELQAALREYYPTMLEAFEDLTLACVPDFITQFPTPADLLGKGKRRWEKFLHTHRLAHPATYQKRLEVFARAGEWSAPQGVIRAKSRLARTLAAQLRVLDEQLDEYRTRIEELFAEHPDAGLFGSLPGAGPKVVARLLAEIGSDPARFESAQSLQCYAGTAPVTRRSGQSGSRHMRRACDTFLRAAVRHWAEHSIIKCAWARTYYQAKRTTMNHESALRCLGQRWLKILWKMLAEKKPYDEARHLNDQVRHGSWVLQIKPPPAAPIPA